ncbi:hypothetical protein [Cellulomonas sp. Marseille-Q8402]
MSVSWRRALRSAAVLGGIWVAGSAGYGAVAPPAVVVVDCGRAAGCRASEDPGDLMTIAAAGAPGAVVVAVADLARRRRGCVRTPAR